MLIQPEFPPHRRRDLLRLAELQVYNECMQSDCAGRVLYEVKTSLNTPELDFAVLLEDVAIFGVLVKGPPHTIHRGEWQRITNDGPVDIPCPLKLTWDTALQIRETVKRRLNRKVFVLAVLVLPDMEPDPEREARVADDRVDVLFSSHNLVERLVDLVQHYEIFNPPGAWLVEKMAETLMPFLANNAQEEEEGDVRELDVSSRPAEVRHADVVNVYQAPVTINNYYAAAPDADDSEEGVPAD